MTVEQLCILLKMPLEMADCIYKNQPNEHEYFTYKSMLYKNNFTEKVRKQKNSRQFALALYTRLAADLYNDCQKKSISDSVYIDTFSDIVIWAENCNRMYGEYGLEALDWLKLHLQLRIFRLGRLQFQPVCLKQSLHIKEKYFSPDDLALNVHVPQGLPLLSLECEKSYKTALSFFKGIPPLFICRSWLLCPDLEKLLPPTSNILAFQKNFTILSIDQNNRQAEERIFGILQNNPECYIANTKLQYNAKNFLLNGGNLGCGFGAFYLE